MRKTVLSSVLAAVVALGVPAAPVQADDRTDRIIAGAVLLGIIGIGIHNQRERERERAVDAARDSYITPLAPTVEVHPGQRGRYLPVECLQRYHTRQGDLRLFNATCLERNYAGYRHLPLSCAVTIQNGGYFDSGFRPDCLRNAGYRLAGY